MNLNQVYRRTLKKSLKVYWWRYNYPTKLNFGDELTPVLIKRLFGYRSKWTQPDECQLAGAGSIIEIIQESAKSNCVHIWGSGFIKSGPNISTPNLQFSAVRGELSQSRIIENGVYTGDPGLLMSLAFPQFKKIKKAYRIGFIPHYVDKKHHITTLFRDSLGVKVIDVLDTPQKVAKDINSCEVVISSSLHGLILSDSYGIPNFWLPLSELAGGDYKFKDYYSVFGIKPIAIQLPTKISDSYIDHLIQSFQPRDIETLQNNLISAFPYSKY